GKGYKLLMMVVGEFERCAPSAAKQFAEKLDLRWSAPKGASDFKRPAVSLKRYPDTKLSFSANCKADFARFQSKFKLARHAHDRFSHS
ncbi:MAG: hypothetical protein WBW01_06125, partial [Terriglobales bacterium]